MFTAPQQKAIFFIAALFLLSIVYHYANLFIFPPEHIDFTAFEKKFHTRLDSIQQLPSPDSPIRNPRSLQPLQSRPAASSRININHATAVMLIQLPHIGPVLASRIIAYRKQHGLFRTRKSLINVKGIGPRTYQKLKDLITVE